MKRNYFVSVFFLNPIYFLDFDVIIFFENLNSGTFEDSNLAAIHAKRVDTAT